MKSQGLYDTEMIADQPLDRLGSISAPTPSYLLTSRMDKSFMVLASTLTVSVDAQLKSTKTIACSGHIPGQSSQNLSGQNSSAGNPLVGLIAQALVTSVNTAAADYVPYARLANVQLLQSMPAGKYHARFGQDGDDRFRDLSPGKTRLGWPVGDRPGRSPALPIY